MKTQEKINKSFDDAQKMMEKSWEMWLVSLGSLAWSQDRVESMVKNYMERNKQAREENTKLVQELMNQVKKNQQGIQKVVREAVNTAFEKANIPNYNFFKDFNTKLDELYMKTGK